VDRSPWRHSARELLGLSAAKAGRPEEAKTYFQRLLSDRATPQGIAERARVMMALLARVDPAPPATEKSETPAKVEPGELVRSDDKSKGAPGNSKKGK
jgi:hypothetical protein